MIGLLLAAVVAVPYQPRVLAHVCTWHEYRDGHSSWDLTTTAPVRGPYDSLDGRVLADQLAQMRTANIAPLVSWSGPDAPLSGDAFLNLLISTPSSGVTAAVLYEGQARLTPSPDNWFDFNDPANGQRFTDDMRHLYTTYFSRAPERFMQVDGRFVVLVWPSHVYRGPFAATGAAVMREMPLYLVSTDLLTRAYVRPDAADVVGGFAAVSAYGVYLPEVARELGTTLNEAWLNRVQAMADIWDQWLAVNAPQVKIALPLQFMFDDHIVRPGVNPVWTTDMAVAQQELDRVNAIMTDSHRRAGRYLDWAVLPSWNEHFEGTAIEPTDRYGTRFLDLLKRTFAAPSR